MVVFATQGNPPEMQFVDQRFHETARFWKAWIAKSKYTGRWRETVNRSALVLKLLISREHGSLIAAPTFSLPEEIGGVRNWDYRFTWLRDAAFTLYALIRLGFVDEAEAFIGWLKGRLGDDAERGPLQVMYGIDGRQKLDEVTLDHLCGYENSRPVRIGNAAYQQLQLDIYGEMMDSIYLANKYGDPISHAGWQELQRILEWLGKNWQRPDEGIWEVRGGPREFLHSRLMCWVAFDRALRLAQKRSLSGPLEGWQRSRDAIRHDIFANFWDDELQSFVQSKGTKDLDASVLLMPLMRFISPVDPMWCSTMKAIEATTGRRHSCPSLRGRTYASRRNSRRRGKFHCLLVLVRRMSGACRGTGKSSVVVREALGIRESSRTLLRQIWPGPGSFSAISLKRLRI